MTSTFFALALVSGARLLYSDDGDLNDDFSNPDIISRPGGRVYTTLESESGNFTPRHRKLLETKNLCGGARNPSRAKTPAGRKARR